jgi:hypothetical protein
VPSVQHRIDLRRNVVKRQRAPGHNDRDCWLACSSHRVDQRILRAWQIEVGARARFTGKNLLLSQEQQNDIGAAGCLACGAKALLAHIPASPQTGNILDSALPEHFA